MSSLLSLLPKPKKELPSTVKGNKEEAAVDATVVTDDTRCEAVAADDAETTMSKYKVIARVGHSEDRLIQTKLSDMQPKVYSEEQLARPSQEQVTQETEETQRALQAIIMEKTAKTQPKNITAVNKNTAGAAQLIKYTPKESVTTSGTTRIIKMVQMPTDPLEPAKFLHKRIPRAPPSPPAPRLHSPPRKVTADEQRTWHIPPCISSWKNPKGYTVPLDKRLASDGKALQEKTLNSRMSDLAETLFLAEKHNREEVEMRAAVEQKVAEQERRKKDEQLRQLAEQAREDARRIAEGLRRAERDEERYLKKRYGDDKEALETGMGVTLRERERLRKERDYERERELRLSKMSAEQRAKILEREADRDIGEKIALGVAQPVASREGDLFDERLFDRNAGLGTGFGAADDDNYNVYDRPLRDDKAIHMIYKPRVGGAGVGGDEEAEDGDTSDKRKIIRPDKGFSGTEGVALREGPVQFERRTTTVEGSEGASDDPFGLEQFLSAAKKSKKISGLDTRTNK